MAGTRDGTTRRPARRDIGFGILRGNLAIRGATAPQLKAVRVARSWAGIKTETSEPKPGI